MTQKLKAIYKQGTFVPQGVYYLPENTEVEITVYQQPNVTIDPEARKEIMKALIQRMRHGYLGSYPYS